MNFRYLLVICSIICVSCGKSFLDTPPTSNPTKQLYINDLSTANEYLNGIYVDLSQNFFHGYYAVYPELAADNIRPKVGGSRLIQHYSWAQTAGDNISASGGSGTETNLNGLWTVGYKIIRSCNYAIGKADEFRSENEALANKIKGQAYTLRALVLFTLSEVYSQPYNYSADASHRGVPIVETADWTAPITQSTVSEVYKHNIDDLNKAIQLLPETGEAKILISKDFAKGLLAKIYFYQGNYQLCKGMVAELISHLALLTENYPANLFNGQGESLFELPPSSSATGAYATNFAGIQYNSETFVATFDIVQLLNNNATDLRKSWLTKSGSEYKVTKFPKGAVPNISTVAGAYYHPVMRASEVYLMGAESYAVLNNVDSAVTLANKVRLRSAPGSDPFTGSEGLIDSIRVERRRELCFEGFRLFEILRSNNPIVRADALADNLHNLSYPNDKAIAPIPRTDVTFYHLTQNNGY